MHCGFADFVPLIEQEPQNRHRVNAALVSVSVGFFRPLGCTRQTDRRWVGDGRASPPAMAETARLRARRRQASSGIMRAPEVDDWDRCGTGMFRMSPQLLESAIGVT
jgi:hypothetical protein